MERIKIGITHGDMNSTSYEIILKALEDSRLTEVCTLVVYGSPKAAAYHRKVLELNGTLNLIAHADEANDKRANIINCCSDEAKVELGQVNEAAGQAAFSALERATQDLKEGKIDALVTLPINSKTLPQERFAGHTHYMEQLFGSKGDALTLLVSTRLRIAIATEQAPLSKVTSLLTQELIIKKLKAFNTSLRTDFGIRKPRIALLALNPGAQGIEEENILVPAMRQAVEEGIVCVGPLAAEEIFADGNFTKYDGVLALYHDQGMAPFQALSHEDGWKLTAGLSAVRTAPAMRVNYAHAGANKTDENSFRQALYAAIDIVAHRNND